MTADELRRLADIAGFSISKYYSDFYTKNISERKEIAIMVKDWRPHIRIEQAMMVAEAFVEWELRKTSEKRYYSFVVSSDLEYYYDATEDTAALSLCRAALAAANEG